MRRLLLLTSLCLVGVLVFASVAAAQSATGAQYAQYAQYATATALPATGGPASGSGLVGLMAGALLVGTGVMGWTLLRRSS
jgi:hypothetical protein